MKKIVIEKINNKDDAVKCNKLLEKLIQSERQFNENINSEYKVNNWFENFYSEDNNVIFIARDYEKITFRLHQLKMVRWRTKKL